MTITARRAWVAATATALTLTAVTAAPSPASGSGSTSTPSSVAAKSAAAAKRPAKVTAKHRTAIRQFRRALRSEAPAGTIAHFKGTHALAAGKEPWTIEGWVEFGGADRYRYVQTPPRGEGAPGERQIVWGRGDYWAVTDVMRTDRGLREVTNVGYTDPAHAFDGFLLGLRYADDAQVLFDTALAGPAVNARATRLVPVALPFSIGFGSPAITLLLDAETRAPVRLTERIALPDGTVLEDSSTDFSLWQQLPANAGAGLLTDDVPLTATIQSRP